MAEIPFASGPGGENRVYRSRTNKVLFGVCGGLGNYLNVDPTLIRLIWIVFSLVYGAGILAYLIAIIIIPEEPTM
ncbi:MAG: PspC domain-containing protein [Candidatus Thorarchaeota archaeon]|nr:PspC domain-containing protein [Candidatus Thorarchaeota archaeon]